jgi:hypothetical protein
MRSRWTLIIAALLFAAAVGAVAYNAGVHQGIAQSGKMAAAPYPYMHPYPYPFFGFGPLLFLAFALVLLRGACWRGRGARFEEWHRRMHERMETPQS